MSERNGFVWRGKRIATMHELGEAAAALTTRDEGDAFFRAYLAHSIHAAKNIGYVAGYYDRATALRIWELTGTAHPITGRHEFTPEELIKLGMRAVSRPSELSPEIRRALGRDAAAGGDGH